MRFAMFCYAEEPTEWRVEEFGDVMDKHTRLNEKLAAAGKLGPNLQLMPTAEAATLRVDAQGKTLVLDGPFAETKEALLGFWIFEAESMDEAIAIARQYASHGIGGALEVRPIREFDPGALAR
jgi:hypothetical protein